MADFNRDHNAPFGEDYAAGDENLIVSKHIFLSQDNKKACGSPHILAIGNPGSGKTRHVILPNLMRAHGSYVIADPDGSLFAASSRELSRNGYSVKVIDFWNPKGSDHYNPLRYVRTDEDVRILVDCILDNLGGQFAAIPGPVLEQNRNRGLILDHPVPSAFLPEGRTDDETGVKPCDPCKR